VIKLLIVFERGRKALALASLEDPELLRAAARRAIQAKRESVRRAALVDPHLAEIARDDFDCLEAKLTLLIPGL
jgi:hypothetical protein